jgi:hypothetical protein
MIESTPRRKKKCQLCQGMRGFAFGGLGAIIGYYLSKFMALDKSGMLYTTLFFSFALSWLASRKNH